jgi:hypothetical protein
MGLPKGLWDPRTLYLSGPKDTSGVEFPGE